MQQVNENINHKNGMHKTFESYFWMISFIIINVWTVTKEKQAIFTVRQLEIFGPETAHGTSQTSSLLYWSHLEASSLPPETEQSVPLTALVPDSFNTSGVIICRRGPGGGRRQIKLINECFHLVLPAEARGQKGLLGA